MSPKKALRQGLFITFEGSEGSGKSTQIKLLADFLRKNRYKVLVLREPGSTRLSEAIRKILLNKRNNFISRQAELLLYLAARAQIVREKIIPALREKRIVLCDRFQDATVAYQGFGLGLDIELVSRLGEFAAQGAAPQLTILLDISLEQGLRRAGRYKDRIEQRPLNYHRRVRKGYLRLAALYHERIKVVKVKDIKKTQWAIRALAMELICRLEK